MKHLKKFETQADYTAAESSLVLPNVSLITETNRVDYKPIQPTPTPSPEYVDLGLSVKWAKCNIGAESETDFGNYYQWGATETYVSGENQYYEGNSELPLSNDIVNIEYGGNWRMPTQTELTELVNDTNKEWTQINGVNGCKFINKQDSTKYIFLPAAGMYETGGFSEINRIWSKTNDYIDYAYFLQYYWSEYSQAVETMVDSQTMRYFGCSVRGVLDE